MFYGWCLTGLCLYILCQKSPNFTLFSWRFLEGEKIAKAFIKSPNLVALGYQINFAIISGRLHHDREDRLRLHRHFDSCRGQRTWRHANHHRGKWRTKKEIPRKVKGHTSLTIENCLRWHCFKGTFRYGCQCRFNFTLWMLEMFAFK